MRCVESLGMQVGKVKCELDGGGNTGVFEVGIDEAVHFICVDGYWGCGSHG